MNYLNILQILVIIILFYENVHEHIAEEARKLEDKESLMIEDIKDNEATFVYPKQFKEKSNDYISFDKDSFNECLKILKEGDEKFSCNNNDDDEKLLCVKNTVVYEIVPTFLHLIFLCFFSKFLDIHKETLLILISFLSKEKISKNSKSEQFRPSVLNVFCEEMKKWGFLHAFDFNLELALKEKEKNIESDTDKNKDYERCCMLSVCKIILAFFD